MNNPLLHIKHLPEFSKIKPHHIEPALDRLLADNRAAIKELLKQKKFTWNNLMAPLENMEEKLNVMWGTVSHLNAVMNNDELRKAYNACLPKLSDYGTEVSHNKALYNAVKKIAEGPEYKKLDLAQRKVIHNALRDFHLEGIDLSQEDKKQFAKLSRQLSNLTSKFEENVLDATQNWYCHITRKKQLDGLPKHAIEAAKQTAINKKMRGWIFTLDLPSYIAVLTYATDRRLRRKMYDAYITRASDIGPSRGKWDNSRIMKDILKVRYKFAKLLGFNNYAERSLAKKMAQSTAQVLDFLQSMIDASLEKAKQDYEELCNFANREEGLNKLQPWDIAYYSEKLQQQRYAITQEELRPYFPENRVLKGLFKIVNRLYGLTIKEKKEVDVWHEDVRFFEIFDEDNVLRGQFYLDLYARMNKRSGAWMDECRVRRRLEDHSIQIPVAYLTCNFHAPINGQPSLLTHNEVMTLFHEFGHGLQHMLTKVNYADVSGINGVPWDAVELPSQFMENWCWEEQALRLISQHYKTGKVIPNVKIKKLRAAKNFQSAMQIIRQLEFGLFDFKLHVEFNSRKKNQIQQILDEVRSKITLAPIAPYNRFQHSFSHIFSGGYAAGYYSYMWADVLACDAFSKFEEEGIFNRVTGKLFMRTILEMGGSQEPMELFKRFRGREPKIDALLRQNGIN